jgi:retron-type reverse transcriptase
MDILSQLSSHKCWQQFFDHKKDSGHLPPQDEKQLSAFIQRQGYLPVVQRIVNGDGFAPPRRSAISKMSSQKKRIVYTYAPDENWVLKFMTHLLIRKYDHLYADNLYSFRAGRSVKDAIHDLHRAKEIGNMWSYKADISNYFNSIPVEQLLPIMEHTLKEESVLLQFLSGLLTNPSVTEQGAVIEDHHKGIMAGTPFSTFLANLYLMDLDQYFERKNRIYARYSDDMILFSPSKEELERDILRIHALLRSKGLTMNPDKESVTAPGEMWTFLGFSFRQGIIDIAPASIQKLKAKMRRKMRALERWRDRKNHEGIHAARSFIKTFNRKLLEGGKDHDLSWALWYFPTITTTESLQLIDRYAQQCIRTLATGKHTKAAYNFRYDDMKHLGYISLVNRYYSHSGQVHHDSEE